MKLRVSMGVSFLVRIFWINNHKLSIWEIRPLALGIGVQA